MGLHRRTRLALRWAAILGALFLGSAALLLLWGLALVQLGWQRQAASPGSPRVLASPGLLRAGEPWSAEELAAFFAASGFAVVSCPTPQPFAVCRNGQGFLLGPGVVQGTGEPVVVQPERTGLALHKAGGEKLQEVLLTPRLVALLPQQDVARWPVPLAEVSPHLVNAVVDLEDRGFLRHPGLSFRGLLRAALANLASGGVKQGGSTITQQVVKVLLLKPERRVSRKMLEAFLASLVEYRYSKREILEAYLNNAYFGQDGGVSVVGVEAAARFYFGKPAKALGLEEAALLAGLIAAPNRFNPFQHPDKAQERRAQALLAMAREGHLPGPEAERTARAPLPQRPWPLRWSLAAHFLDLLPPDASGTFPTTMDPMVQEAVFYGAQAGLSTLEQRFPALGPASGDPLQVAVVVLGRGGKVLAVLGSREGKAGELNRALAARRPIGSLVKPFLVALALERGWRLEQPLLDEPLAVPVGRTLWTPQNHDGRFRGTVSMAEALVHSVNVPMVRLGLALGLEEVTSLLRRVGLTPPGTPAELLGAVEATPWEVARAFTPFLEKGKLVEPRAWGQVPTPVQVFSPEAVTMALGPLREVVQRGTAAGFAARCGAPLAGKTGTTDNRRDSWFVALRPRLLTVVWVGTDRNRETGLYGASGAGLLWQEIDLRLPRAYKEGRWE